MCHQSVGLAARTIEAAGFATVTISSAFSITQRVMPPRTLFVDAPLGHTAGPKHEPQTGRGIVEMALGLVDVDAPSGTITDSGYRWPTDAWRAEPLSWSRKAEDAGFVKRDDRSGSADTRTDRSDEPQFQNDEDRAAALNDAALD